MKAVLKILYGIRALGLCHGNGSLSILEPHHFHLILQKVMVVGAAEE